MSQTLSIFYTFDVFDPDGTEPWSRRAVQLMTALGDRARHVVAAQDCRGTLPAGVRGELAQVPPPLAGAVSVARYDAIARAMRGHDLVLSHGAGAIDAAMARRAFPRGTPPIVHHEDPAEATLGGSARLYRRIALGAAAGLVVSGTAAAGAAMARWKVAADRVHAIPDGIDLAAYARGADAKATAGFRRKPTDVVIGVVADRSGAEELALLVRAVAGLAARFRLVVVGIDAAGEVRAAVERAALAMGIDDRLVLPDAIGPAARYLGGFDVLLLPMRGGAAPAIVVEAMAAGVPVMALRGGGTEALLAAENGALLAPFAGEVPLRDALQPLATDATLRAQVGAANRARAAAMHDGAAMIARSAAVYAAAIGRPGVLG
jgi:glycosyltransferase involved in cell wall biosynthesis